MNKQLPTHNLHIHMYNFKEILELFGVSYHLNLDDLKRAKTIVLKMHPDKSGLSSEYFLFYKKAFELVVQYYNESQKTSQIVPQMNPVYEHASISNNNKSISKQVNHVIQKMDKKEFSQKFNELFEKNMVSNIDSKKNDWFSNETPLYNTPQTSSTSGIGIAIEEIKQNNHVLIKHRNVEDLMIRSTGSSLYEDEYDDQYISSDPFSKLKFDDLRKVHKDETVFAVKESDIQTRQQYTSYDHLNKVRNSMDLTPLEKEKAEQILREKENQKKEMMLAKQHQMNLRTLEYNKKNETVLSSFLRLEY